MTDNTTLSNEINIMITSQINQIPQPVKCKITKVIDSTHVNIKINEDTLENVECIGNNIAVNNTGILIFLNGNNNEFIVLTK